MQLRTLHVKISLVLTVLLTLTLILFYYTVSYNYAQYQLQAQQYNNRYLADNILKDKGLNLSDLSNHKVWKRYLVSAMIANPEIDLYFISPKGKILKYAVHKELVVRKKVGIKPIEQFLDTANPLPIYGDNPKSLEKNSLFSVTPIVKNEKLAGYLYIILNANKLSSGVNTVTQHGNANRSLILNNIFVSIVVIIIFVLLSGLIIVKRITSRITRLSNEMTEFKESGFSVAPVNDVLPIVSTDEVDKLHKLFNQLAELTVGHIHELEEQDNTRRELVSQVCHDVRSPLTILNSYIELLTNDEGAIDPEERKLYLDYSASQSRRITGLIDDLFLLSKLDDVDYRISRERVNIGELLSDIVQTYKLKCETDNNVTFDISFCEHPICVSIDVAMIDRVLSNLIENAIKHSSKNSVVYVAVTEAGGQCILSVKNSGPGLCEEECEKIFSKFFRTNNSITSGLRGSGLGLTICKKIMNLHGGDIVVVSDGKSNVEFRLLFDIGI